MTIIFTKHDRKLVAEKLEHAGLYISDSRIDEVLYNIEAAFQQQVDEEMDYMINEFEDS